MVHFLCILKVKRASPLELLIVSQYSEKFCVINSGEKTHSKDHTGLCEFIFDLTKAQYYNLQDFLIS